MKKTLGLGFAAASLVIAAPVLAEEVPQQSVAGYNCDYNPSCEVAPGIYGKMSSPVMSKFNLSIGGYVKLDAAYNSEDLGNNGVISPSTGALPSKAITGTAANSATFANKDQSILSMRQTRLWLKVAGPTFLGAKTNAVIEGDFYGDDSAAQESPQFRMRLAYGTLDWANTQVMFGQQYDIFAPMVASTQDFRSGAPYGAPNTPRSPQIRLTQKINFNADNQLKLVVGVQDPAQIGNNSNTLSTTNYGVNLNYAGQIMYVSKSMGTAPGYYGVSMNPLTIGVFGLFGSEKVTTNAENNVDSWGYGLYAFVPVLKSSDGKSRAMTMSFEGQAYMAANQTFNGATSTAFVGADGNLKPARNWAATGQVIFYPTQSLGITGGWGARYAYNNADYNSSPLTSTNNYLIRNQEVYANVTYDLNAAVRVGAEYQNLETVYGKVNGTAGTQAVGSNNTVRLVAYYFF